MLVDAPAEAVRARVGRWASVEAAGEARCRLRMSTDALDWAAFALGTLRADFTVVGPPELRAQLREWGDRFRRGATR